MTKAGCFPINRTLIELPQDVALVQSAAALELPRALKVDDEVRSEFK